MNLLTLRLTSLLKLGLWFPKVVISFSSSTSWGLCEPLLTSSSILSSCISIPGIMKMYKCIFDTSNINIDKNTVILTKLFMANLSKYGTFCNQHFLYSMQHFESKTKWTAVRNSVP